MKIRMYVVKTLLALCSLIFLSACKSPENISQSGRYIGTEFIQDQGQAMTSEIVAFLQTDSKWRASLELSSSLASAIPKTIEIHAITGSNASKAEVVIDAQYLNIANQKLKLTKECANGVINGRKISLCWSEDNIRLEYGYGYTLTLQRSEGLPDGAVKDHVFSLDELMGRAKYANYSVAEEAQRLYQEKAKVSAALGGLYPSLNIKAIATFLVMGSGAGIIEAFGSLVPFLFPSNWYKWRDAQHLYEAEKASFAGLRANEMSGVQSMYYLYHRDKTVLKVLDAYVEWLRQLSEVIAHNEHAGVLPPGSVEKFNITITQMLQDREQMRNAIRIESASLIQSVGLIQTDDLLEVEDEAYPDIQAANKLRADEIFDSARVVSLELKTLDHLIEAAKKVTKEVQYGFLDPMSGMNLGFSTPSLITISKAKEAEIRARKDQVASLLNKRCHEVRSEITTAVTNFKLSTEGKRSSQVTLDRLIQQLSSGTESLARDRYIADLNDAVESAIKFEVDQLNAIHMVMINLANINRLTLGSYYAHADSLLPKQHVTAVKESE